MKRYIKASSEDWRDFTTYQEYVDSGLYDEGQLKAIREGLKKGVDMSWIANPNRHEYQIRGLYKSFPKPSQLSVSPKKHVYDLAAAMHEAPPMWVDPAAGGYRYKKDLFHSGEHGIDPKVADQILEDYKAAADELGFNLIRPSIRYYTPRDGGPRKAVEIYFVVPRYEPE